MIVKVLDAIKVCMTLLQILQVPEISLNAKTTDKFNISQYLDKTVYIYICALLKIVLLVLNYIYKSA